MALTEIFCNVKKASRQLASAGEELKNNVLNNLADAIMRNKDTLLKANAYDLELADSNSPMYDRLMLTDKRLDEIAEGIRNVASLPSPLDRVMLERRLPNGLRLRKISVPFGVIGAVYEARPNVSFDVFSLCLKSGNACVLKGGKDADWSNRAIVALIHNVLEQSGMDPSVVELLPSTHEATTDMLRATEYIDVCIPRGGRKLIDFVRRTSLVPVIETGAGVVHAYFDKDGDTQMGSRIINNAKTRRVSVCNALDCLIIHSDRLADLPELVAPLKEHNVTIHADARAAEHLKGHYPDQLLKTINPECEEDAYGTEFMDYVMAIKTVDSEDEALNHIARYGSGHSECIITSNEKAARYFQRSADAACVYWNAPTSFTDGAQFGLGAEIGISTQKLGPRGPMGLEEMTTYKWVIDGDGQTREP